MDGQVTASNLNNPVYNVDYATQVNDKLLKTFTGFKDFTVTAATCGLTAGEKTSFWLVKQLKSLSEKWFTHFFLTMCLVLYSVIGAVIFMALEGPVSKAVLVLVFWYNYLYFSYYGIPQGSIFGSTLFLAFISDLFLYPMGKRLAFNTPDGPHEKKDMKIEILSHKYILVNLRKDFAKNITRTCEDISENDEMDFIELFEDQLLIYEKSLKDFQKSLGEEEPPEYKKTWRFWNSMLYAATIYSTIGYGHIAPKTASGRAATIIYSIIGIPLFLIVLADFGKLLTRGLKYSWAVTRRFWCKLKIRRKRNERIWKSSVHGPSETLREHKRENDAHGDQHEVKLAEDPSHPKPGTEVNECECEIDPEEIDDNFDLPVSVALTLLVTYLFIGAALFTLMEDWTYSQSFYFTFISMSTIGLGDFVPTKPIYMFAIMFYLIFGLALTAMCINVVQNKLNETFREARQKLGATIGLTIEEDEDLEIKISPKENTEIPV